MSSNGTLIITDIEISDVPKMPYRTPSGVVALATLAAVIAVFIISIVIYYYKNSIVKLYWRYYGQIKEKSSTADKDEDELQPEKLREDSVINHELDFNPDAFSYAGDVESSRRKPEPSPCPSIFRDDLFLEEVMTSVADICSASKSVDSLLYVNETNYKNKNSQHSGDACANEIIDNIINNVFEEKLHLEYLVEDGRKLSWTANGISRLTRNKSYQDAIDGGLDLDHTTTMDASELLKKNDNDDDDAVHYLFFPSDSDNYDASKSNLEESNQCFSKIEKVRTQLGTSCSSRKFPSQKCKWQSTPILDDLNSSSIELQRSVDNSCLITDLDQETTGLSQCQSYSPVYKLSFSEIHGSNRK